MSKIKSQQPLLLTAKSLYKYHDKRILSLCASVRMYVCVCTQPNRLTPLVYVRLLCPSVRQVASVCLTGILLLWYILRLICDVSDDYLFHRSYILVLHTYYIYIYILYIYTYYIYIYKYISLIYFLSLSYQIPPWHFSYMNRISGINN